MAMTLTDIMHACGRAYRLAATPREKAGVERAAAAILDAFDVPAIGADRARFIRIVKG